MHFSIFINFPSNDYFAANIDMSLAKLAAHAQTFQNKTFLLVQQVAVDTDENKIQLPTEAVQELYLTKRMIDLGEAVENIDIGGIEH